MKEFDLRPFEVKRPIHKLYRIRLMSPCPTILDYSSVYWDVEYSQLTGELLNRGALHPNSEFKISPLANLEKEWTFEDIQVGWFFKCSDGDLYWKHEHGEFRSLGSKWPFNKDGSKIDFAYFFVLGTNLDPDPDLRDLTITNVYDCPELAKVLMIESVIT